MSADSAGVDLSGALPMGGDGELVHLLRGAVTVLFLGGWRTILWPPEFRGHPIDGPEYLVRLAAALRLVARSQHLQAQGHLQDAWNRLSEAADLLPSALKWRHEPTNTVFARRPEPPNVMRADIALVVDVARLIWAAQFELRHLKREFAADRERKAHDELIEAVVHYLQWVEWDPATDEDPPPGALPWDDGVTVDRRRTPLLDRATDIRWFCNPSAETGVSQAPWQDNDGFCGLHALARDRLADRPEPVPWRGLPGTTGMVVRCGALRAWKHAVERKEDQGKLRSLTGS